MQSNVLLNIVPNIIIRYAIRNYARNIKKFSEFRPRRKERVVQNPGLQNQLNVLYKENELKDFKNEDFEELETDFMNAGEAHKLHRSEVEAFKEKQKLWIVGRKYFKENNINFLTWNDKEQIRHLHQSNPEEWTVEKLSEGFPALPSTIAKLLKNNWRPRTENRIKNHDKNVENNWKLLKEGKLNNLSTNLLQHVQRFSNRKLTKKYDQDKIIIQQRTSKNTTGEFGSIIENYQKLVNEKNQTYQNNQTNEVEEATTTEQNHMSLIPEKKFTTPQKQDRRLVTLDDLKQDIENKIEKFVKVDEYEKMILGNSKKINEDQNIMPSDVTKIGGLQTFKVESNKSLMTNEDQKILNTLRYPEKIAIPKEKYKKGSTYKINDCFYDDDGEFLYRVPGMY